VIKRVNFTGRRRIPRSHVEVSLSEGQPRQLTAHIDLTGISFPPAAEVMLEATSAGSQMVERIPCGVVSQLAPPANHVLKEAEGENLFFTLKVIDREQTLGRLLGIAEHIRPERAGTPQASGRRGILPVEPADLGQELWRLEFKDQEVVLHVNRDIPNLKERIHSDPALYAAIYPEIVRRVLTSAIAANVDIDEEEERWPVLWQRFGRDLHPTKQRPPSCDDPAADQEEWIEDVVQAFCEAHQFKDKYQQALAALDGDQ
jgi:hypothetical protein